MVDDPAKTLLAAVGCPYEPDSADAVAWVQGFNAALSIARDDLRSALDGVLDVISDLEVDDDVKLNPDQLARVRVAEDAFEKTATNG